MNVAFRPARPEDFDYCERLYFAEMERINRELKLDRDLQVASFRRQWEVTQVRIITLDGADIGWLQSTTRDGSYFLGQIFVEASRQRRGIGTEAMHRLIGEATRLHQAMTLGVVKTNPAKRLYERLGFRTTHEDDRKFYMRREPVALIRKATREDIPRLFEIRGAVRENRLGDPGRVTVALCEWFIENSAFWLWVEDGRAQGFSAATPETVRSLGFSSTLPMKAEALDESCCRLRAKRFEKPDTGPQRLSPNHQRVPRRFIGGMAGSRSAVRTTDRSSSEKKSKSVASKSGRQQKSS
jgi:GNAT superfamily N-acetyltransferase